MKQANDDPVLERKVKDFPEPIEKALRALSNKNERLILLHLLDRKELSYTDLHRLFGLSIEKGSLNYHLKKLLNASLVRKYYKNSELIGDPYHSFYEPTELARRLVHATLGAYVRKKILEERKKKLYFQATMFERLLASSTSSNISNVAPSYSNGGSRQLYEEEIQW